MAKTWTKSGHRDRRLKQSTYDRRHGQNVSGDFWGMLFLFIVVMVIISAMAK